MHIELITPDKKIFAGEAVSATFPGTTGSFQVLNHHAPLVAILGKGDVVVDGGSAGKQTFVVDGGVVEVLNDKVLVLAEAVL
ncbi:MAG: F0F1 ATP synthase subunit epsilon [Sphingobacteriaceae bacterium]|nr:F0F1 ATP synthase subunit epsilon [Cytophagaceae bacterium]